MKSPVITLKQLESLRACERQRILFKEKFGESVTLTKKVVLKHYHEFDLTWMAVFLLDEEYKYNYEKEEHIIYMGSRDSIILAQEERNKVETTTNSVAKRDRANKKVNKLLMERKKQYMLLFYRLYKEQCNAQ
jgi:hypothetical protein